VSSVLSSEIAGASVSSLKLLCYTLGHVSFSMCFARVSHYQLPKGVVHHQVEDGERALLTVDAGMIA
jgi:hypothetical protein